MTIRNEIQNRIISATPFTFSKGMRISRSDRDADEGGPTIYWKGDSRNWFRSRSLWVMNIEVSESSKWLGCRGILSFYRRYWRRNNRKQVWATTQSVMEEQPQISW